MQGRGALWVFCCEWHIKRQLPASPAAASLSSIQIFPNFELAIFSPHWRSGHNGAFHGGNSLHYTEEAEEEGKGGRLEMPKATMPTNIEHWPGPYLLYLLTTPKISSLLWYFHIVVLLFLAIFLKLAQIICPPPHLCLSPPGYEHSNQFYLLDCSPVPQQSAPEIQPFLYQIANCLPQQTGPLKNYVKNSIYWGFWEKRVKKGPSLSFLDCDLQRADMNVKVTVVLLNVQRRRSPQPHQKLIFVATTDCRTNLPPRTGNPQYYSRYIRFKKNHCNPPPLEYSMWPL